MKISSPPRTRLQESQTETVLCASQKTSKSLKKPSKAMARPRAPDGL